MTKIFVLVFAFFISFSVNATGEVVCPSNITCDYEAGVCGQPSGWSVGVYGEEVLGKNPIGLSKIAGYKNGDYSVILCQYAYSDYSGVIVSTTVNELTGSNWVFSGFGKKTASCSGITDPVECSGSNQLANTVEHEKHLQQMFKETSLAKASSNKGYYKYKSISIRGNHTYYSCLPSAESPSGWGWIQDGNRAAALPLCECNPFCNPTSGNRMCTSCS
jgi:hypothetical protein